ncbi:hypothetical protein [Burkholderia sp. MBR-1]|uniref:hypothetical protein n=1 Tax=Burkholderia sp. MBR-1 TaxID=2732364 RepID=UPI0015EF3EC6|nr:hypothetical protein [Burkholderia sp. MBR-1]QMI48980.1 hypothetical protein MBR110_26305 [Burkholderia sp. MBR-1]
MDRQAPVAATGSVDLPKLSIADLLATHCIVIAELQRRGVLRSGNNPTGDYAEWLVSSRLGLELAAKSCKGYDAIDAQKVRYEIKARRVTPTNPSTQMSPVRDLAGAHFDFLIAVVFDSDWNVSAAAKIPHRVVPVVASFRKHVNGHVMHLGPAVFSAAGVENITALLGNR